MNLENQVCSLELAKKLKELGVEQDSLYTWVLGYEKGKTTKYKLVIIGWEGCGGFHNYVCAGRDNKEAGEMFSAFTVAELGEMLPIQINLDKKVYLLEQLRLIKQNWFLCYVNERNKKDVLAMQMGVGEANARAKMKIYLLENKLIK